MNSTLRPLVLRSGALALGFTVLLSACSKTADDRTAANAPANPSTSSAVAMAPATWDTLKNSSYEQRTDVAAKANAYADKLDADAKKAKGATADRLAEARDELRTAATEVSNASASTWQAAKDKVGDAWKKAQTASQNVAE